MAQKWSLPEIKRKSTYRKIRESGLIIAERTLKYVKDIHFQILEQGDVVRHPLVAKVIQAYSEQEL